MGITVQFESYEEMIAFAGKLVGTEKGIEKPVKKATKTKETVVEELPRVEGEIVEETQRAEDLPYEEEAPADEETPSFTLEEVRAKLTALTRAGKQKEVKAILDCVKAKNLTSVESKDYAVVMEKAGAL